MKRLLIVLFLGCSFFVDEAKAFEVELSIRALVIKKAIEHRIDATFANAVVKVESNYNPRMRGKAGEYGLGQIKCQTARSVGFKENCDLLLDPETNLEYSYRYLSKAIRLSRGNDCFAASLYNTGFGVKPKQTEYCKKVLAAMSM
jgi:soluble lytic murein transglycosylase-like protein